MVSNKFATGNTTKLELTWVVISLDNIKCLCTYHTTRCDCAAVSFQCGKTTVRAVRKPHLQTQVADSVFFVVNPRNHGEQIVSIGLVVTLLYLHSAKLPFDETMVSV